MNEFSFVVSLIFCFRVDQSWRVRKVTSEFYKTERVENFKNSTTVKLLRGCRQKIN